MNGLFIDYSRTDMARRMKILEMANGNLTRAIELERWVQGVAIILPSSASVAASEGDLGVAAGAGPFDVQEMTESCGGGENRGPAAPVGSREASDRKAWSGEPPGPKGTTKEITEPEVASGPQDPSPIAVGLDTRPEGTSNDLTIPPFLRRERASA